ncbi:MAG: hypothetical protein AAGA99_10445 [Actinomycetota bacterium]
MGRVTSWLRRRVQWLDLTRDWRLSRSGTFPSDVTPSWGDGRLILRRNTTELRRNTGSRWASAEAVTLDYRHQGGQYAVQIDETLARRLICPGDWVIQVPGRTIPLSDIVCRTERADREPSITAVLTANLAASRATRLSPDGLTREPLTSPSVPGRDDLRAMHQEVAAAWRQLTDVRFKLLALIPVVSGIGLFSLLDTSSAAASSPQWARSLAAAFGAVITVGLYLYDRRNSQLYDDLISRGKHLEHAMGFSSGVFQGRLKSTTPISHGAALRVIYSATLLAWLLVLIGTLTGRLDQEPPSSEPETTELPAPSSSND